MNKNLLGKLALNGLKNNKKAVIPYVLVSSVTIMVFHILMSLTYSRFLVNNGTPVFKGANFIILFIHFGSVAVAIFSVIFLLYGNRFVQKARKKEIGLYGVLGLSRRNIGRVLLLENMSLALASIVTGILAGTFLNKLMVLFLYKLVHQPVVKGMELSIKATVITACFFGMVFLVLFIINLMEVRIGNPIELLKSENIGDKEPKVKWVSFSIGVLALFMGYYLAVTVDNTYSAMGVLFKAIALVTIATYVLFMAGSIFVLKMLKKNKDYYFKTRHFISVSNLMFRMKHNAAGLASICVLSTGVILLMVCSGALVMLGEQNINSIFKRDIIARGIQEESITYASCEKAVEDAINAGNITEKDKLIRFYDEEICVLDKDEFMPATRGTLDFSKIRVMYLITADDYNLYTGEKIKLGKGEILRYSSEDKVKNKNLSIFGKEYSVRETIEKECLDAAFDPSMILFGKEILVVSDKEELSELLERKYEVSDKNDEIFPGMREYYIGFNVPSDISTEQVETIREVLEAKISEIGVDFKEDVKSEFYGIYGGAFFVGIFLAALFLIATVMIIFYKQLSEGMEDKKRFEILSTAGLSDKEAKGVIKSQVMIMFFMPAVTAIVHMLFASRIVRLFLAAILYVDTFTFNMAIMIVSFVFLGVYVLVYKVTSRQYYEIVYGRNA